MKSFRILLLVGIVNMHNVFTNVSRYKLYQNDVVQQVLLIILHALYLLDVSTHTILIFGYFVFY